MSETYNVVFTGELLDGFDLDSVQRAFANIFKLNQEKVNNYFNGQPKVLKKDVSHEVAAKYKSRIESVGGKIKIQPHGLIAELKNDVVSINRETPSVKKIPVNNELKQSIAEKNISRKVVEAKTKRQKNISNQRVKSSAFDDSINLIEQGRLNQIRKMQAIEIADDKNSKIIMLVGIVFIILGLVDFSLELLQIFSLTGTYILSISSALVGLVFIKSSRAS